MTDSIPTSIPNSKIKQSIILISLTYLCSIIFFQSALAKFFCKTSDYILFITVTLLFVFTKKFWVPKLSLVSQRFSIWYIIVIAGILRLIFIFTNQAENFGDDIYYKQFAVELATGKIIINSYFSVGCSYIFAPIIWIFGDSDTTLHLFLCILSISQIMMVFVIGKNLVNHTVGMLAALLLSLYPEHIFNTTIINGDVQYATFTLAFFLCSLYFFQQRGFKWIVFAGLFLFLANWIRSTAILLLIPLLIVCIFHHISIFKRFVSLSILCLFFILSTLPISLLHYLKSGSFSATSQQTAILHLYIGINPVTSGGDSKEDLATYFSYFRSNERPQNMSKEAFAAQQIYEKDLPKRIKEHFGTIIYMCFFRKPIKLWGHPLGLYATFYKSPIEYQKKYWRSISFIFHRIILLLTALAFWRGLIGKLANPSVVLFTTLLICATTSFHMIFSALPRYHHMFLPVLCLLAACTLYQILGKHKIKAMAKN